MVGLHTLKSVFMVGFKKLERESRFTLDYMMTCKQSKLKQLQVEELLLIKINLIDISQSSEPKKKENGRPNRD